MRSSPFELEKQATLLLEEHARNELCRNCGAEGTRTGLELELVVMDAAGTDTGLRALVSEFRCERGHRWHSGEGRKRGLDGDYPVLLPRQLAYQERREVHPVKGVPEFEGQPPRRRPSWE